LNIKQKPTERKYLWVFLFLGFTLLVTTRLKGKFRSN
jgi:hypothetical protein